MADNINKPSRSYGTDRENGGHEFDEDPLVELARIVSDDGSFFQSAPAKPAISPEPGTRADPFSADLEAELMEQFEASFADEAAGAVDIAHADEPAPEVEVESAYGDYTASDSQAISAMATAADMQSEAVISTDYERSEVYESAAANDRFAPAGNDLPADPSFNPHSEMPGNFSENPDVEPIDDAYRAAPGGATASTAADGPYANSFEMEFAEALADTTSRPFTEDFTPEFGVEAYGRDPEFQGGQASSDGLPDDDLDYAASQYAGPLTDADGNLDDAYESRLTMPPPAAARSGGRKGLIAVVGVLAVVILGGGVAAYIGKIAPNDPAMPAPVIKAEGGDVKIMADAADTSGTAPSVLDPLTGQQAKLEEKLIDRIEEPQQIARVVLPGSVNGSSTQLAKPVGEQTEEPSGSVTDAIGKTIDRVMQQPDQPPATPKFDPIGPRKVRTVVVKPDGSFASNDNAAGLAQRSLPPAPAAVETMEIASVNSTQLPKPTPVKTMEITSAPVSGDTGDIKTPSLQPPPVANTEPSPPVMDAVATMDAMVVPAGSIPRPKPANASDAVIARAQSTQATRSAARSTREPVNLLAAPVAPAAPAATDQPRVTASTAPTATATGQSGYVVQITSQRSADQAKASFAEMQRRYRSILGGFDPNIQRADLGAKGIYYRARVGPMMRDAALHVCEQLKSAGGNCFVTR